MHAANEFHALQVPLPDGTSFVIVHNLPLDGKGSITLVVEEWILLTRLFTAESFCLYLYEKRQQGKTDRVAMTRQQFEKKFQMKFEDYFKEIDKQ